MSCCQIYGALAGKVAQEGVLDFVNITKVRYCNFFDHDD